MCIINILGNLCSIIGLLLIVIQQLKSRNN